MTTTEHTEAVDALTDRVSELRAFAALYDDLTVKYATLASTEARLAADYAKRSAIHSARADEAQGDLDDLIAQVAA